MLTTTETKFDKDLANKKVTVTKNFHAPLNTVWDAWTRSEILDQWWAPKPWRSETKSMDFKVGGTWLYAMVGPKNERQWSKADYTKIEKGKSFELTDAFTDEKGTVNKNMPQSKWKIEFKDSGTGTTVIATLNSEKKEDLQKLLDTGFEEGFKMGLGNLEEYLEQNS